MPARKVRKTSTQSAGESESQLSKEQRDQKRKRLFMQQFEKEAQERLSEMEGKLDRMLATVDRVFRVEMMKMPPAMQRTLIKDLMCDEDTPAGEVTIAIKNESTEITRPLTRKSSKKGLTNSASSLQRPLCLDSMKAAKMAKSRSLVNASVSSNTRRAATTSSTKRTRGRVAKLSDATLGAVQTRSKFDEDSTGTSPVIATATISTSGGETLCLSDAVKDNIDIRMLDDTAVLQIYQLRELMDYLCKKVEHR